MIDIICQLKSGQIGGKR